MSENTALAEQLGSAALLDGTDRSLRGVRLYADSRTGIWSGGQER